VDKTHLRFDYSTNAARKKEVKTPRKLTAGTRKLTSFEKEDHRLTIRQTMTLGSKAVSF